MLLSPSRLKPISSFKGFVKENADVAYHFVADRFGAEELKSTAELPKDMGKLVENGGEKMAIYKDLDGEVTALNPVCTHVDVL